jgi:16S rRNA (cytosine967-C5)-methyltransferase
VGYVVDPQKGQTSLDVCSAPGGKATHLAELCANQGEVWATDHQSTKLKRVQENAQRLGLNIIKVIEKIPETFRADRVLVDAPCSGLGTLRRHAEIRYRVQEQDLGRLADQQLALLSQASQWVKPHGYLIYSTCSTEPEENEQVVRLFLQKHTNFVLRPGPGSLGFPKPEFWSQDGFFRTFPQWPEADGHFAARMERMG